METTEESATIEKVKKNDYESLDQSIVKMKVTFGNALLPEILPFLEQVGYTDTKIIELKDELTHLETLSQNQIKEHADQSEEQEKYNNMREEINSVYMRDRGLLRILFKIDRHSWVALKLDKVTPKAYAAWFEQLSNFYGQLEADTNLITKVETVGITMTGIVAQKNKILSVQELKQSLRKELADAQKATEVRDEAFDNLYHKYSELIQYAKVLLPNDQMLEALGILVR